MDQILTHSGDSYSDTGLSASPTSRQDTYVVLNLLPPSRIEWLRQQSLHVAEVFRRSALRTGDSKDL